VTTLCHRMILDLSVTNGLALFTLIQPRTTAAFARPEKLCRAAFDLCPERDAAAPGSLGKSFGGSFVSIIRVGLAETKNYSHGWDSIFGSGEKKASGAAKKPKAAKAAKTAKSAKSATPAKKKTTAKKSKKKATGKKA
jgi:hypothetical protein